MVRRRVRAIAGLVVAILVPPLITLTIHVLQPTGGTSTGYSYLYLGAITLIALGFGLSPAIVAALLSTVLIDYFFVPPLGQFTVASATDLQNLVLFVLAALVVGFLADARRRQEHRSTELAASLRSANIELERQRAEAEEGRRSALELVNVSAQVDALAQADRLKTELLANVSHELRTPLGAIVGMSSALLDPERLNVDAAARQYLEAINGEGRHLARLVGDLLEMARLESGTIEMQLEPVEALEAMESAAARARNLDPQLQISVHGPSGLALADDDSLQEILRNLIENASRVSSQVSLDSALEDGTVQLRVSDRGPGVEESEREAIFDRFYQAPGVPAGDERPAGSGLGLAICRRLAEAMQGRIWYEPRDGGGAVFAVSLRRYTPPHDQKGSG